MRTYIEIRGTEIKCFDGVHKMVFAKVVDNVNGLKYEVHEWLDDNNHVDREESDLYHTYMLGRLDLSTVREVFDAIDSQLDRH